VKRHAVLLLFGILCQISLLTSSSWAANPPVSQQMSGQERSRELQSQSHQLQQQVEKIKTPPETPAEVPEQAVESVSTPPIWIKKIDVTGVTLFPSEKIKAITGPFEGRELTFAEIQNIADKITDLYRTRGFITSRAYIPPQDIELGVVEIRVVEGTVGNVEIQGNRYFSRRLISSYVTLKKGDSFNFVDLKKDVQRINDHPDRDVKAVLVPGSATGSTDIVLNETDRFPVHVSLGYDNGLSYFLRRNVYSTALIHNNFLGRDDTLAFQYARGDGNDYYHYSGRYLYPLSRTFTAGFSYSRSRQHLGGSFAETEFSGESQIYSLFTSQEIVRNDYLRLNLTLGFDYKDVENYLLGELLSRDYLRIPKMGFNIDVADDFGRTVIFNEIQYGVPGIMRGTKESLVAGDTPTSRAGADGRFFLDTLNVFRLQRLPLDSTLLWKNQFQFSPSVLTATEQFQAGGPVNNRGFASAHAVGDKGYAMSWELAVPPYFLPKQYRFPFDRTSLYNAFRLIGFYDWANVHLNEVQPGQNKNETLSSAGCGARLTLADNLFASYEIGWPVQGRSGDEKSVHQWLRFTATF
jgi:hemolysin activation/secretion protein